MSRDPADPQAVLGAALRWYDAHAVTCGVQLEAVDAHEAAEALRAVLAQLLLLQGYARHTVMCQMSTINGPHVCTCGLAALLPPVPEDRR